MTRKLGLTNYDLSEDNQYQMNVILSRPYETDGITPTDSQRDSINRGLFAGMTGRKFSSYWQWQGVSLELISALQFTRFILDYQQEIIGRDIFLRNYEIEPAVIWALVFNALQTNIPVELESNGQHVSAYRTETGKRTYHGKKSDGMIKLKNHAPKSYKRNRKVNF